MLAGVDCVIQVYDRDNWGPVFGGGRHIRSFINGPHQLGLPATTTTSYVNCVDNNGYEHCAEGPHAFAGGSRNGWNTVALEVYAVELVPAYTGTPSSMLFLFFFFPFSFSILFFFSFFF